MQSHDAALKLLAYLRTSCPIVLLLVFVVAFVANSVSTAKHAATNGSAVTTGPGGRPLPKRSRSSMHVVKSAQRFSENTRSFFKWLSLVILLTFVADAVINITHVMIARSEHWWRGQSLVVSGNHAWDKPRIISPARC